MPADLRLPFDPSCCEGGVCGPAMSTQPCGCDPGVAYHCADYPFCGWGKSESAETIVDIARSLDVTPESLMEYAVESIGVQAREDAMRDTVPAMGWAERRTSTVLLPVRDAERKACPIFTGMLMYFPLACAEVARVSKVGNDQHNPGEPMHWAREKSTDQLNTAQRHMMDHGMGNVMDTDGTFHLAKACWRLLAELQLTVERVQKKSA